MFKKGKAPVVSGGKIENVLGSSTSFSGTVKSDGNLRIDGLYQGHIETAGNVIVGPSAKVMADIVANSVQVWGAVRGNITASGSLEILPSGRVWGDVRVSSLLIDEGGLFRGECVMGGENLEPLTLLEAGEEIFGSFKEVEAESVEEVEETPILAEPVEPES